MHDCRNVIGHINLQRSGGGGIGDNLLNYGYQDFAAGIGINLTITDNDNGDVIFDGSKIINSSAVIVRKNDVDSFAYDGALRLFSDVVEVSSHNGINVVLSAVPHASWGDIRVYYLYNYGNSLPDNFTLAPKFLRKKLVDEINNLFANLELFYSYIDQAVKTNSTPSFEGLVFENGSYKYKIDISDGRFAILKWVGSDWDYDNPVYRGD